MVEVDVIPVPPPTPACESAPEKTCDGAGAAALGEMLKRSARLQQKGEGWGLGWGLRKKQFGGKNFGSHFGGQIVQF